MSASGHWLAQPIAVLRATDSTGSHISALLSLAEPRYNATRGTLAFKARHLYCQPVASVCLPRPAWLALSRPSAHKQYLSCTSLCRQVCRHAHCTGFSARPHVPCMCVNATMVTAVRQATILPATSEGARLPTAGGATQRLQSDAQNGLAAGVLTAPPADARLTAAALFIDQNAAQLGPVAALKWYYYFTRSYYTRYYYTWG